MTKRLDELARQHGVTFTRPSPEGGVVAISDDTKRKVLTALNVDIEKCGIVPEPASADRTGTKSERRNVAKSYLPNFLKTSRVWGLSLQLYELRSTRNWGIGDFADLSAMVDFSASIGADFIGLNPLHAPFLADPDRCSPYEPSNRQMLNPLYIAVDRVPGFYDNPNLKNTLEELRQTDLVDYCRVAKTKLDALGEIWTCWRNAAQGEWALDRIEFDKFMAKRGAGLRRHALFEALSCFMIRQGFDAGWRGWPEEYQNSNSTEIEEFEREHADDICFHSWLQWLAHIQLADVANRARKVGLRIGLYLDLAVGEAIDGSATWSERGIYISAATIGSPPDPFATDGQDWHLAAILPSAIAAGKISPYRRMLDAAMQYAGAIRIDHAAALRRLFLVPLENRPEAGAYVDYPQQKLLKILADASAEHKCLVIGEDLGLLPEGLQSELAAAQILSYRILSYERDENSFKPAENYPALALACISTHDHHTLSGWWLGADIEARAAHGIVPADLTLQHFDERKRERDYLKKVLYGSGIKPPRGLSPTASDETLMKLVLSAHRFIAKTPSMLAAVRLADLTNERRPTNVPGTSDSYPNWKPKLSVLLEKLPQVPTVESVSTIMQQERGHMQ